MWTFWKLYVYECDPLEDSLKKRPSSPALVDGCGYRLDIGSVLPLGSYEYALHEQLDNDVDCGVVGRIDLDVPGEGVFLDFSYTGSLKLKPLKRPHSRELKKIFIEQGVAPWQRMRQPIVIDSKGNKLALGTVCLLDQSLRSEQYSNMALRKLRLTIKRRA